MYKSKKELVKLKEEVDPSHSNTLIRIKRVIELTGISKSYIYQLCGQGLFPKSIQLVAGGASVAWVESEVHDWIESRIRARDEVNTDA